MATMTRLLLLLALLACAAGPLLPRSGVKGASAQLTDAFVVTCVRAAPRCCCLAA